MKPSKIKPPRVQPDRFTGWSAGLLQDDSRELSRWFAGRLGSLWQLKTLYAPQRASVIEPQRSNE